MKSFLLKEKVPICRWKPIPHGFFFEGKVPDGYSLAICPSDPYVILDIDRHGDVDGFDNIPEDIKTELESHFSYNTKNNGKHVWLKYSGEIKLANKASGLGIDLRTSHGYVKWYLDGDIRDYIDQVKETSPVLNEWLEKLFNYNCFR